MRTSWHLRILAAASIVMLTSLVSTGKTWTDVKAASGFFSACIGHHPQPEIYYTGNCTGHDEPEIDPLSNLPGSGRDLTWTIVLPTNGPAPVDSVGPTFWTGGTVTDHKSLFEQAFLEVQFYPNSLVVGCAPNGNYYYTFQPNIYTACSPVWKVDPNTNQEVAAFNTMLTDSNLGTPLIMHAGDTITDHQYTTRARDGMHITITDKNTGHSGTIVLRSQTDGPLMPAYSVAKVGNSLGWGLVNDAPNSLVWEIGHTGNFTTPPGQFCLPGSVTNPPCYSYNIPTWLSFSPLQIKGVTFSDSSSASSFGVVSDYGGKAEVNQYCGAGNYGTPFCWYPWYAYNGMRHAITYGGNYPGTSNSLGEANQFYQQTNCGGPFGPNTTYCTRVFNTKL